ncbi:GNAT family N-acetyltransferase [Jannaschia donghaensis]|uniref:N-acetyltransferase domain-containing protein n=1 Tax=Jannaschia donghaensis TaxID=420998 RepID=A0A0M6YEC4_9RHOB|nr:GNAT family N-acetyltransferase [Jannaschia donghaensis]CTQ48678.1 hypothetical protein JDO7802_00682 [Jannaschia donghaensis]
MPPIEMLKDGLHPVPIGKVAAIVTHLEMTAVPELRPATLPDGTVLSRFEAPATDWYRDLFTRIGGPDWLWSSRLRMSDADLRAIIAHTDVEVFAVTFAGRAEGLLELDFRDGETCELAFFGLTPAAQGIGAGRAMLTLAITRAFARPIARLHLHTCTLDSPVALPFYLRSGFVAVRREVEIMDDPRLDGTLAETAGAHHPILR